MFEVWMNKRVMYNSLLKSYSFSFFSSFLYLYSFGCHYSIVIHLSSCSGHLATLIWFFSDLFLSVISWHLNFGFSLHCHYVHVLLYSSRRQGEDRRELAKRFMTVLGSFTDIVTINYQRYVSQHLFLSYI